MSQTQSPKEKPDIEVASKTPSSSVPRSSFGRTLIFWLGLISVGCVATAFWSWYDAQQKIAALRAEVAKQVLKNDQLSRKNAMRLDEMHTQLTKMAGRLVKIDEETSDLQAQQTTFESLYKGVTQQDTRLLVNDIEHLLMIASQQLQLAGDVRSAIAALETAELVIGQSDNPSRFLTLRKAINADMETLKATPEVDLSGIAIKLEQLIHTAESIPLMMTTTLTSTQPVDTQSSQHHQKTSFWQSLANDLWSEIRQLIQVRYVEHPQAALLSPEQAFFVRENLKLRLLAARVDLLSRANANFHHDLSAAETLIRQYFDLKNQKTIAALQLISELQHQQLQIQLPTLNASYAALKQLSTTTTIPVASIKGSL